MWLVKTSTRIVKYESQVVKSIPSAIISQIFIPMAALGIPTGMPTKEAKAERETHPVTT